MSFPGSLWLPTHLGAVPPLAGVSTASTVPANQEELGRKDPFSHGGTVTPPPKKAKVEIAQSEDEFDEPEDQLSAPKTYAPSARGRSPTLHYSPTQEEAEKAEKAVKTNPGKHQGLDESNVDRKARKAAAVKSMATKPGKKKAPQEPPPAEVSPKLEKPHGEVAQAVRSSLQRASTVDMKSTVLASQALEKKKKVADDDGDDGDSDNSDGVTAKDIRRRKEVHARYMRFSRSFKSAPAVVLYMACMCTYVCV